jgi:two-component system, chemotaxis family, protein-glutamate methylesterase/glutaminase
LLTEGKKAAPQRPLVVAIGTSAGGLDALTVILSRISKDFSVPILVVQHLAPDHPSHLVELLGRHSSLPVHEAQGGESPIAGHVYVAPPDHHLIVEDGRLALSQADRVRFSRPSVDRLFESVARSYEGRAIAVILTGAGSDGKDGARAIREAGGQVVVQDQESSFNYGMPGSAKVAGSADVVLDIHRIASYLDAETGGD